MAINAIVRGAYATIIQLQGGAVTTLAEYRQSGSTTPITGVMRGAYDPLIQNDAGQLVPLVDHLRSTGGQLIAKTVQGSYPALVRSDDGTQSLTEYEQVQEQAES